MFDVTKFNNRNGWTIKDLARRLFCNGGESRVGMWSSGNSNPRYEAILKLIDLGVTAEELFGKEYADKLLKNSLASPIQPEIDKIHIDYQDPKFQELVEKALIRIEERKRQGIIK